MDRSNPYEAAFEAYLKEQGLCHVAVDESRRAHLGLREQRALQELTVQAEPVQLVKSLQLGVARLS